MTPAHTAYMSRRIRLALTCGAFIILVLPAVAFPAHGHAPPSTTPGDPPPAASPAPTVLDPTTAERRPVQIFVPYAAKGADLVPPAPRVWGTQFMMEPWPEWHVDDLAVELPRARGAGLTAVRTNVRWSWIEPENTTPEDYDWERIDAQIAAYTEEGFQPLIVLIDYPAWATEYRCGYGLHEGMETEWREFVRAIVERYSQPPYGVTDWEIGNEPDGETIIRDDDWDRTPEWAVGEPTTPMGGCWGDRPGPYKTFLQAAYEEIKAASPSATVVSGSVAHSTFCDCFHLDFIERLMAEGGGPYFDVLGVHWYPDAPYDPPDGVDRLLVLANTAGQPGFEKPVWLTETYRLTHPDWPDTEANQIEFLTRQLVRLLGTPELERVYWYGWLDLPDDVSDGVGVLARGIVRNDYTPKAAFPVLPYTIDHTNGRPEDISTDDVIAYRFDRPRDTTIRIIAWSREGGDAELPVEVPPGARATITRFPQAMLMGGECCDESRAHDEDGDGVLTFAIGADASFIEIRPW